MRTTIMTTPKFELALRQLKFSTVAQPLDDARVPFHNRGRFAVSANFLFYNGNTLYQNIPVYLLRTTIDVVHLFGRVYRGHVRKEHGTVTGLSAAAQHFFVTVRC